VIVDIDALEDGQLAALMRRAFMNPPALERAIRAWSVGDEEASRVVASVDAERLAYIEALLANAGTPVEHLSARASFIYWAYLGRMVSSTVPPDEGEVSALASLLIQPQPGEP
ncbi:MAG: TetR/AcrR family transcriptional regulator, partial [Pseudomonadota bacterium]